MTASVSIASPVRLFRPLSEDAYDVLRGAILGGRLAPGARIVEADIARQMAISRSPIREAVRKLERDGLVQYVPRRGTVVVGVSREDIVDAYELRAHLEAYAARLAALRASDAHLAAMTATLERMRACAIVDDLVGVVSADMEFHRQLCQASGSRGLVQAWDGQNTQRWTLVSGLTPIDTADLSLVELAERHSPILAALEAHLPDAAEHLVRQHVLDLGATVLAGLDDEAVDADQRVAPPAPA